MITNFVLSIILVAPLLHLQEMIIFLILYNLTKGLLVYYGFKATNSDPTDKVT